MNKILFLVVILSLSGCAEFNKEYPLTPDDKVILPSVNAIGTPTEASISQIADMLVIALNKSREEENEKKKSCKKRKMKKI